MTELLSTGLITHQEQREAGITSPLLQALIWLPALFRSPRWRWISLIFPRVSIQTTSWTKGGQEVAFSPKEWRERGAGQRGGKNIKKKKNPPDRKFLMAFLAREGSSDRKKERFLARDNRRKCTFLVNTFPLKMLDLCKTWLLHNCCGKHELWLKRCYRTKHQLTNAR